MPLLLSLLLSSCIVAKLFKPARAETQYATGELCTPFVAPISKTFGRGLCQEMSYSATSAPQLHMAGAGADSHAHLTGRTWPSGRLESQILASVLAAVIPEGRRGEGSALVVFQACSPLSRWQNLEGSDGPDECSKRGVCESRTTPSCAEYAERPEHGVPHSAAAGSRSERVATL